MPHRNGLVSAGVLAIILMSVFSGALVGLILASVLTSQIALAIITAFVATVLALVAGHVILGPCAELPSGSALFLWNIIVASLIGGLAGHELSVALRSPPALPFVDALSGLLASVLIASFAVTIVWPKAASRMTEV